MKINIASLKCNRCSHEWTPRKPEVRVCPKCHSPYWDRKRPAPREQSSIQPILDEMIKRIVRACDPEKIILFGSYATGDERPGSDVDLLVVTKQGKTKREQAMDLYEILWDVGVPKDVVVVRPEEFERYREVVGTVIYPAAHKGRLLYERAA